MRRIPLFVAVIVMALFARVSFGQVTSDDSVGTVKDSSRAIVSNANVTVSSQATDTTTTKLTPTSSTEELASLPTGTVGLGVINASLLSPGVASTGGIGIGVGPSIGGQRPRNNN